MRRAGGSVRSTLHGMDPLLIIGASLRLTRFVVTDDLGGWLIREPVHASAQRHGTREAQRLAEGIDCPFCVGQWIAAGVLGSYLLARRRPATLAAWRYVAGSLALNHLTAHIAVRINDV